MHVSGADISICVRCMDYSSVNPIKNLEDATMTILASQIFFPILGEIIFIVDKAFVKIGRWT